jgi:hypothetical protein
VPVGWTSGCDLRCADHYRRHKPKASAPDRSDDQLFLSVVTDRPASRLEATVQGGGGDEPPLPNAFEQLLFRYQPVTVLDQIGEHREHLRLHMARLAPPPNLAPLGIQLTIPEHENHEFSSESPRRLHQRCKQ